MHTGYRLVGVWVGLLSVVVACGSSSSGGSAGDAGRAGGSGATAAAGSSVGGQAADGDAGGAISDDAGSGGAGQSIGEGVSAGEGGEAGLGAATTEAGAAGEAGSAGRAPHWLSFSHYRGNYAYDVSRYPDSAALYKLTSKVPGSDFSIGPWSPDGRSLLYVDVPDIFCRDMTQAEPGPARLMAVAPPAPDIAAAGVARLSWSGDSRSVALTTGTSLLAFDPLQDAPQFHLLSASIRAAAWAPSGDHLLYRDDAGFHVVSVAEGVPGVSQPLDITLFREWSPDGRYIAASSGSKLLVTDVSGPSLVTTTVESSTGTALSVSAARFSPDAKGLAIIGTLSRTKADLFYARLKPLGVPTLLTPALPVSAAVSSIAFWSPDSRWLGFTVNDGATTTWQAVDTAGTTPGVPFLIKPQGIINYTWLTERPNTFVVPAKFPSVDFVTYDLSTPEAEPVPVLKAAIPSYAVSPHGDWLAADDGDAVAMRNLRTLAPPADILVFLASSNTQLRWSPDGQFLSIIAQRQGNVQGIIRVDGDTASQPLFLAEGTSGVSASYWQPVFR